MIFIAQLMMFLTKAPSPQTNHVSFRPYHINYECISAVVDIDQFYIRYWNNIYKYF